MILQQLYADANAILEESTPAMYDIKPVRWTVPLRSDGSLAGREFISNGGGMTDKNGLPKMIPYVGRTINVRAILLSDKPAYSLGLSFDGKPVTAHHEAFKKLVSDCAESTGESLVLAVEKFLDSWKPDEFQVPEKMGSGDIVEFTVDGRRPTDLPSVQRFWAECTKPPKGAITHNSGQCLVTGIVGEIEQTLPGMIKRLPDGQTSGTALVSVNCPAFESYGLKGGMTSPVSREAAERFTKALNHMIANEHMHITVGGIVYVFWTRNGRDDELLSFIDRPDPAQVKKLIDCYRTGQPYALTRASPEDEFYAFAASASGARVVIRDWISTTIRDTRDNLSRWFSAQAIVNDYGQDGEYFGIYRLAAGLYRDANKEMRPPVPQMLLRAALYGEPLSASLMALAVLRNRAEQRVATNRAALIKAVFVTRKEMEPTMTSLDSSETNPAYICGRLLAQLESIQYAAVGKLNATLTDRYFGAASTRPSTIFGVLLSDANKAHLPKIRKRSAPTYNALQNKLAEILAPLGGELPRTLTLEEQGRFALGYYFQRADNRREAIAGKAAQNLAVDSDTDAEDAGASASE